jgi:hypothetical protein
VGGESGGIGQIGAFAEEAEPACPLGRLKPRQEQPPEEPGEHPDGEKEAGA